MLAYLSTTERGLSDRILTEVAARLQDRGLRVAGAVQVNVDRPGSRHCDMNLHVLTGREVLRISQRLGEVSRGCKLDPGGLEQAVGIVGAALAGGADLLIVNKFGKQEAAGRGFRPLIGEALTAGIPVLTAVNGTNRAAFLAFCEDMAEELAPDAATLCAWCEDQCATIDGSGGVPLPTPRASA